MSYHQVCYSVLPLIILNGHSELFAGTYQCLQMKSGLPKRLMLGGGRFDEASMPIHISPRVSEPHRPRSMLVSKTSGVQHDLPRRSARKTSLFPVSTECAQDTGFHWHIPSAVFHVPNLALTVRSNSPFVFLFDLCFHQDASEAYGTLKQTASTRSSNYII